LSSITLFELRAAIVFHPQSVASCSLQSQFPCFSDQTSTIMLVSLGLDKFETGFFINTPGGLQDVVRLQRHLSIPCSSRECDTLIDETLAYSTTARYWFNEQ